MGMMKNYILELLHRCSDEKFGQDAIEHGITFGLVKLTYDMETDVRAIVGEPGKPETGCYDQLCEAWRRVCADHHEQLIQSYIEAGVLEEILRPVPLAVQFGGVQTPAQQAA